MIFLFSKMSRTSNWNPSLMLGSITSPAVLKGSPNILKRGRFQAPGEVLSAMKTITGSLFRSTNSISATPGPMPLILPLKASDKRSCPAP